MVLGRCQASKITRPVGQLSLFVSYILILLKAHSTLHLKHTHTSIHPSIQHGISSQTLTYIYHGKHIKPSTQIPYISTSQTLACSYQKHLISYGIISWSRWNIGMATSKHTSYPRQKTNLGIIRQTCYCISLLKEKDKQAKLIHVHHPNKIIIKSMHVHVNA